MDEAFGLSDCLGHIGFCADVFDSKLFAGVAPSEGFVARSVVGHEALDLYAERRIVSDSGFEAGYGAGGFLIWFYLCEGDAGMIVDGDMDELPAFIGTTSLRPTFGWVF